MTDDLKLNIGDGDTTFAAFEAWLNTIPLPVKTNITLGFERGESYSKQAFDAGMQAREPELEALRERVAELERDAARYQWLRKDDQDGIEFRDGDGIWRTDGLYGDELDAVVDAAITKGKA